jgi:integrase
MPAAMSRTAPRELFALVESFFLEYLPRQRGASPHTVRAYRDTVKLLFEFTAQRHGRDISSLALEDLDADAIAAFLDHIEANRSNSAATRNCRRAALRSFFKHLLRNDLARSLQYTRVLAIPSKKAGQSPATYSKPTTCGRSSPNRIGVPTTDGAITRCCCSFTTAAPASARPSASDGPIYSWFHRGR